jgi:ammonium transporter Rh
MVIITIETIFYTLNRVIVIDRLNIHDLSGSMVIHVFGAYFGLFAAIFFNPNKFNGARLIKTGGNYQSNLVAMIGTLFLFMYWPSFNASLAEGM